MPTVAQFTLREKLLYDKIRNKERALCKLRIGGKNLDFVCDAEENILTEGVSTYLNAGVSGY
jgi:hypothetical protein